MKKHNIIYSLCLKFERSNGQNQRPQTFFSGGTFQLPCMCMCMAQNISVPGSLPASSACSLALSLRTATFLSFFGSSHYFLRVDLDALGRSFVKVSGFWNAILTQLP